MGVNALAIQGAVQLVFWDFNAPKKIVEAAQPSEPDQPPIILEPSEAFKALENRTMSIDDPRVPVPLRDAWKRGDHTALSEIKAGQWDSNTE